MIIRKRLGDVLLSLGIVSKEELDRCLELQTQRDMRLGEILVMENSIKKEQLYAILEFQTGVPYVDLSDFDIEPTVPKMISEELARRHKLIPVSFSEGRITIVMVDPFDILARDDVRITTGFQTDVIMGSLEDVNRAINSFYDSSEVVQNTIKEINEQEELDEELVHQQQHETESEEEIAKAPVVRLVNSIIVQAVKMKASDIHIEAFEKIVKVRYRIDGGLKEIMLPPKSSHAAIVARIKILGGMDISEKRIPQDGRWETVLENVAIDMRISILPTVYGEKIVIRLLKGSSIQVSKEKLGFTKYNLERFDKILKAPEGIVLLTGPTGSGKTTTLYAALRELNRPDVNIITVEDPVEYRLEGVNQVQVNVKAGLSFAAGLRSILRQDPDVVMVGEIRDSETAEIAIRAAITGHVVLSTIHTNDTASTISRLVDMGIETFMVSSSIMGIVAQRLVKKICPKCKTQRVPTIEETMMLGLETPVMLNEGKGCHVCGKSGYSGRIAIHEIFVMDRELRNMINTKQTIDSIKQRAIDKGMKTLSESCKELVINGVTTIDEMIRVTYSVDE